jgi:thiol-disulfide isomerase/thioredoxin
MLTSVIVRSVTIPMFLFVCGCAWTQSAHSPKEGDAAPEFSIKSEQGNRINPTKFAGKLLVLNFWETSCVPCVEELPSLSEFARKFRSEHVMVVAIGGDEDAQKYHHFLRDHQGCFGDVSGSRPTNQQELRDVHVSRDLHNSGWPNSPEGRGRY